MRVQNPQTVERVLREKLESLVSEMLEKRIYLDEAVRELEKKFILSALAKTGGNQSRAAEVLGLHRNTLGRKIGQYKLNSRFK